MHKPSCLKTNHQLFVAVAFARPLDVTWPSVPEDIAMFVEPMTKLKFLAVASSSENVVGKNPRNAVATKQCISVARAGRGGEEHASSSLTSGPSEASPATWSKPKQKARHDKSRLKMLCKRLNELTVKQMNRCDTPARFANTVPKHGKDPSNQIDVGSNNLPFHLAIHKSWL